MSIAKNIVNPHILVRIGGTFHFDIDPSGTAVIEANRDIPSRWRRVCD